MFFQMRLSAYLKVKPEHLGPGYKEYCEERLRQEQECTGKDGAGMIVTVTDCRAMDHGKLQEGTGLVMQTMSFSAIVLRLFKGEVVNCTVFEVNSLGFFAHVDNPTEFFRPAEGTFISDDMESVVNRRKLTPSEEANARTLYDSKYPKHRPFDGARVFVSRSSLPAGWAYTEAAIQSAPGGSYVGPEQGMIIKLGDPVTVKLIASKHDKERVMAVGTTDGDGLGPRALL